MTEIKFIDKGIIDYQAAWDFQKRLFDIVLNSKKADPVISKEKREGFLVFCEHPHVYTLGKSGSENNLLINQMQLKEKNASFYKIDRGGDITYHGPGQIVGYPIIDLELLGISVKVYVNLIESRLLTRSTLLIPNDPFRVSKVLTFILAASARVATARPMRPNLDEELFRCQVGA